MAKTYVVTQGTYSDYHIEAVYSSQEKAQAHIDEYDRLNAMQQKKWRHDTELDIEEYELDLPVEATRGAIRVTLNYKGKITMIYHGTFSEGFPTAWDDDKIWDWEGSKGTRPRIKPQEIEFLGTGKDVEHARRSAEEFRRTYLVEHGY